MLLCLINCGAIFAKSSLSATGSLYSQIQYTPEQKWEAWHRFQLVQEFNFTGEITVYANLGGWTPRFYEKNSFPDYQPNAQFTLNRIYAKVEGPVLTGGRPIQIGFGDLAFSYSPYSVWLNRWDKANLLTKEEWANPDFNYNMVRRGISVEELSLLGSDLSAFYLWDGLGDNGLGEAIPYPYRTAFGAKLETRLLSFIYSQYLDAAKSDESTSDELVFEEQYLEEDRVFEIALKDKQVGPFIIAGTYANHLNLLEGAKTEADLSLFDVRWQVANETELLGKYYNYGQKFNPRYRDRTPRFEPHTGQKLSWNLADRYRGQKGTAFGIRTTRDDLEVTLLARNYVKNTESIFNEVAARGELKNGRLDLRGLLSLTKEDFEQNQFGTVLSDIYHEAYLAGSLLIKHYKNFALSLIGCFHDKKDEYTETEHSYGLRFALTRGIFEGLKLELGKRNLNGLLQDRLNLEYRMPVGLIFIVNYANPNFVEQGEYDRGGERIIKDNCIKLISEIRF